MSDKDKAAGATRPAPAKPTVQPPRLSNARMGSIKEHGRQLNTRGLQLIAVNQKAKSVFLPCTEEKIYYAWLRGKKQQQIAREYRVYREEVEEITRKFAAGNKSGGPDGSNGGAAIPFRKAA